MTIQRIQSFPMVPKFQTLKDVETYFEDLRRTMTEDQYLRNYDIDVDTTGSKHYKFKTITGITNDVVADQMEDTLTLASGNTALTIVGTSATDTITWTWAKLGLESLADPGADRIFFWDESENASKWLACDGTTISITETTLSVLPSGLTHDILSATHSDSTASAVSRGSLITGQGATPKWVELAIGATGYYLKSDGTDAAWAALPLGFGALTDPGLDQILFWDDSAGALDWSGCVIDLSAGTGISLAAGGTGMVAYTVSSKDSEIVHDNLSGFVAAEHYDWTNETHDILTTGAISLGTSPSTTGRIRIPNNAVISARNAAGSANLNIIYADTSNRIIVGSANSIICHTSGNMGVGSTATDIEAASIYGRLALVETTAPSLTAGWGKLYVKSSDSRLYFMDDGGTEFDLTAAGAGGAPLNAEYIVGAANSTLTAEVVKAYLADNLDPDAYPSSPNALDDEFEDGSLNVKWTAVNDPGLEETTYDGCLWTTGLTGIASASTLTNLVILYQTPIAGSGAWKVAAKVAVSGNTTSAEFMGVGIGLFDTAPANDTMVGSAAQISTASTSGRMNVGGFMDNGAGVLANMTTTLTSYLDQTSWLYIALEKSTANAYTSANTYIAWFSVNGIIWSRASSVSKTFANIPNMLGLYFRKPDSGSHTGWALVDWFRRLS